MVVQLGSSILHERRSDLNISASDENSVRGSCCSRAHLPHRTPVNDSMSSLFCLAHGDAKAIPPQMSSPCACPVRLGGVGSVSLCDLLRRFLRPHDPSQPSFIASWRPFPTFDAPPLMKCSTSCSCCLYSFDLQQGVASRAYFGTSRGHPAPTQRTCRVTPRKHARSAGRLAQFNRLQHVNLNRMETRQKASIMFESFRVTAMRTPRSWAKDISRSGNCCEIWQKKNWMSY